MIVLVLQSFLAVFNCALNMSVHSLCVPTVFPHLFIYVCSSISVYKLLAPTHKTMVEAVIVCSLDLMEGYHSMSVSSSPVE